MLFVGADIVQLIRLRRRALGRLARIRGRLWPKAPPTGSRCASVREREPGYDRRCPSGPAPRPLECPPGGSSFRSRWALRPAPRRAGARLSGRHTTISLSFLASSLLAPDSAPGSAAEALKSTRSLGGHVQRGDILEDRFGRVILWSKPQPSPRLRSPPPLPIIPSSFLSPSLLAPDWLGLRRRGVGSPETSAVMSGGETSSSRLSTGQG